MGQAWMNGGKLVIDDNGNIVICDECPCNKCPCCSDGPITSFDVTLSGLATYSSDPDGSGTDFRPCDDCSAMNATFNLELVPESEWSNYSVSPDAKCVYVYGPPLPCGDPDNYLILELSCNESEDTASFSLRWVDPGESTPELELERLLTGADVTEGQISCQTSHTLTFISGAGRFCELDMDEQAIVVGKTA